MSRVLKFRAWDKHKKCMIQPYDGDFIRWHAMSNWRDCLEVMQFTGLTDSEGVEIYESDVIEVYNWGFRSRSQLLGVSTVEWCPDEKGWRHKDFGMSIDSYDLFRNVRVIGNIHEHPELQEGDR